MTLVVVPVRYPLTKHSKQTLARAVDISREKDASLTILHVNLYQNGKSVTRTDLKDEVERQFGPITSARYVVRKGFLVEESILDEVAAEEADIVVIGHRQASRWRRVLRRFTDNPNIERYLRTHLDCDVVTVESATA